MKKNSVKSIKEKPDNILEKIESRVGQKKTPIKLDDGLTLELPPLPANYAAKRTYLLNRINASLNYEDTKKFGKTLTEEEAFPLMQKIASGISIEDLEMLQGLFVTSLMMGYPKLSKEKAEQIVGDNLFLFMLQGFPLIMPNISIR